MNFKLKSWQPFSWAELEHWHTLTKDGWTMEKPKKGRRTGLYQLLNTFEATWLEVNTGETVAIRFDCGLMWDGASIPKAFEWYLPRVDERNLVYTLAGLAHDALYGTGAVPREMADDLFRGTMRDAGIPRRKASFAEWLVGLFGKSHYGVEHDTRGIRFYCHVDYRPGRGNAVQR